MFWGITLESGKKYTQVLQRSFRVTMAALGIDQVKTDLVSVIVDINNAQYVLCTLQSGKILQQPLDLNFTEGEEVSFFLEGEGEVHLTGYLLPNPTEYELATDSECSENEENDDYERAVQLIKKNFEKENKKSLKKEKVTEVSWQGKLAGENEENEMEVEHEHKIDDSKEKNNKKSSEMEDLTKKLIEGVSTQESETTSSSETFAPGISGEDENNNITAVSENQTLDSQTQDAVEAGCNPNEETKKPEKKRKKERTTSAKNKVEAWISCDVECEKDREESEEVEAVNGVPDAQKEEEVHKKTEKKRKNRKKNRTETETNAHHSDPTPTDSNNGVSSKDGVICTTDENESVNNKQAGRKKKRKQNENKENPETDSQNPKRKGKKRKE